MDERANIKIVKSTLAAQGQLANLDQYSALVLAHVFKRYLQSFPEPLTTHRLYDSFILATCKKGKQDVDVCHFPFCLFVYFLYRF